MECPGSGAEGIATVGRLPPYGARPKTALAATEVVRVWAWGWPTSGGETMLPRAALRRSLSAAENRTTRRVHLRSEAVEVRDALVYLAFSACAVLGVA